MFRLKKRRKIQINRSVSAVLLDLFLFGGFLTKNLLKYTISFKEKVKSEVRTLSVDRIRFPTLFSTQDSWFQQHLSISYFKEWTMISGVNSRAKKSSGNANIPLAVPRAPLPLNPFYQSKNKSVKSNDPLALEEVKKNPAKVSVEHKRISSD